MVGSNKHNSMSTNFFQELMFMLYIHYLKHLPNTSLSFPINNAKKI